MSRTQEVEHLQRLGKGEAETGRGGGGDWRGRRRLEKGGGDWGEVETGGGGGDSVERLERASGGHTEASLLFKKAFVICENTHRAFHHWKAPEIETAGL